MNAPGASSTVLDQVASPHAIDTITSSAHGQLSNRSLTLRMPHKTSTATGRSHSAKAERARQFLSGGGVSRDDSDDELGLEDHPWQWINCTDNGQESYSMSANRPVEETFEGEASRWKDSSLHAANTGQRKIVGARMGNFKCMIGDCVLLKAEGTNEAWVGLICEFREEEEEGDGKAANFMWFSTEKEIRNKQKKRTDTLQVRRKCALTTSPSRADLLCKA